MVLEYPENFVGEIQKITLVSMPCFYLCPPDNGVETEQKLTISSSGKVTFTSKEWTMPIPNPTSGGKWRKATVSKEQAKNMLETIITPFRNYEVRPFCTDVGNWLLTAYNTKGEQFKYEGSLIAESFEKADEISYYVRKTLMMPDLFVFDGQHGTDNTKVIYLSVEFSEGGKTYYYQTTDETIKVGDKVVVPVGSSDEKIVTVVEVESFSVDEVPMPLNRVKGIIEKFEKPDKVLCPLCNKYLTADECYLIEMCSEGLGPVSGYPEIIEPEIVKEKAEMCLECRYHYTSKPTYSRKAAIEAHKYSSNNKPLLKNDKKCGCFYCLNIFDPKEIEEYIEDDNPCDEYGTALCPYCDVDSVLPESAGYPLTKEFLSKMYKVWFDSGSGIAHHTPFGFIKLLLDGKEVSFRNESVDIKPKYPDIDGCQYISYDFKADGKNHTLSFIIDDISSSGDIESDEMLEAISFEKDGGKITLGCAASFGDPEDYNLDYDGSYIDNGIEIFITPKTKSKCFEFAVSWIQDLKGKDENQTWFASDPFDVKKWLNK